MIEILFGESEAASMKAAKSSAAGEVICYSFMLDVGDIKEPTDSPYRKELIYSIYAQDQWEEDEDMEEDLKNIGDVYAEELHRLRKFLDAGEKVRIWYSDAPYSRCGFYHLCQLLEKYENEIRTVKLPEYIVRGENIVAYMNWGEVAGEEFAEFLTFEKELSKQEVRLYSYLWHELVRDNSPLRAVINGRVLGVPENFYDFQIFHRLTHTPIREARLIGDILGSSQISTGDWWYAKRIEHYIRKGTIQIIEDSKSRYARMICMAGE